MTRGTRWKWGLAATLLASLVSAAVFVAYRVPLSSERLRQRLVKTLADELDAEVELGGLEFHAFPRVRAVGTGLVVRHRRHPEVPLIAVDRFTVATDVGALLHKHVSHVQLEGLAIQIPPRDLGGPERPDVGPAGEPAADDPIRTHGRGLVIDDLVADGATFALIPRDPAKHPKRWLLHEFRAHQVGIDRSMPFTAVVTNAVPPGLVHTAGAFGPWNADMPGETPVDGRFTFEGADLSVFKGLSGTLGAHGVYSGELSRIQASGETLTPDFALSLSSRPVALHASYDAVVDGTSGDTTLNEVSARFLNTSLVASGGVYDTPDPHGRLVQLDVRMRKGRLEDVLQLVIKTPKPTMAGALALDAKLNLMPGDRDVIDRLGLDGDFSIDDGRFTDREVQQKINTLSGRAQGKVHGEPIHVASDFAGHFVLRQGRLTIAPVQFDVPGAVVEMRGSYALHSQALSFGGHALLDAKLSQTMTGWKSLLLKPFDPLFRRNGRTYIPLTVSGTRNAPSIKLDVKRIFRRGSDDPATRLSSRP